MVDEWEENFDYANGEIVGSGGWTGSTGNFSVLSNELYTIKPTAGNREINNNIAISHDFRYYDFRGYIAVPYISGAAYRRLGVWLHASNWHLCGIKLISRNGNVEILNAINNQLQGTQNVGGLGFCSFVLIYDRLDNVYKHFEFNGVVYSPSGAGYGVYADTIKIQDYGNVDPWSMSVDSLSVKEYTDISKYTRFPRWQKTKYGMRPTY
jgi:hypothetical protein